ncbi:MAG: YggS family pyridoxal phosphate-dependent enzyme [Eubacteriales bacterium]
MTDFTAIKNAIDAVRADIPEGVRLVAATKTVSPEVINFAFRSGITEIGENRVEELCTKYPYLELPEGAKIHFIGTLQRRKVRSIIDKVDMIQSVDHLSLAREIDIRSREIHKVTDILIEVNIGEEESKSGVHPDDALELYRSLYEMRGIRVRGVMAIPPKGRLTEYYDKLYKIYSDILKNAKSNDKIDIISIGMSADYREAIALGSNMVRVGTAIFGERNKQII